MFGLVRRRLTYGNVLVTLCFVLLLGGQAANSLESIVEEFRHA